MINNNGGWLATKLVQILFHFLEDDKVLKSCIHLLFNYEQTFSLETKIDMTVINL